MQWQLLLWIMKTQGKGHQWGLWPQLDKCMGTEIHLTIWIRNIHYLSARLAQKYQVGYHVCIYKYGLRGHNKVNG